MDIVTVQQLHELYIWKLRKELSQEYDALHTNVEVYGKRRVVAEIDILAEKNGELHVFEVKASFRPTKARMQFRRIRHYFHGTISKYFLYAAEADRIVELSP